MARQTLRRASIAMLAVVVLLSIGSTTALAHDAGANDETIDLGSHDVQLSDTTIHVEDLHITGTGLPEKSVDEGAATIDGEFTIDGFTFTVNGQEVQVGHTHVVLDDVGVTVEDVSVSDEEP